MFPSPAPIPAQQVSFPLLEEKRLSMYVKRLDLVHPHISGNKYYKLKYNLAQAQQDGFRRVLTFGGAFSNHIHATAIAARVMGVQSVGCIRGEILLPLNPTLQGAKDAGMTLIPMDRDTYRRKGEVDVQEGLKREIGDFFLIPEGGTNEHAIRGCKEILTPLDTQMDAICVALGTGGTFAGIAASASKHQRVIGISSLKGSFVESEVQGLLDTHGIFPQGKLEIYTDYHCGGYAKHNQELLTFMRYIYSETGIPLDPIYTGKLMLGIWDLIKKDCFPPDTSILFLHTGGLQGIAGFEKRWGISLYPGFS